jgi:hypothetical protein
MIAENDSENIDTAPVLASLAKDGADFAAVEAERAECLDQETCAT